MKKDISVIRESITKLVALLTKRSIKVTQQGAKAFVSYRLKDGAIERVNIPYIPDDASEEFVSAIQGFLDHEVGHVLFTDPKVMMKVGKEGSQVKSLANIIEDVFIERKMAEAFQGSIGNLNSVRNFFLNKISKPKIIEALKAGDINTAKAYASVVQFRAWGGQQIAIDFLANNPEIAKLNEQLIAKLGPAIAARVAKANSTTECLELAREVKSRLYPPKPEPEKSTYEDAITPPKPEPKPKSEPEPEHEPELDEGPGDDADDSGESTESDDEGSISVEEDDSEKTRPERSETEEAPIEGGSAKGSEDGGEDATSEEDTDEPESEPGEDEPEPGEGEGDESSGEFGDPEEGDDEDAPVKSGAGEEEASSEVSEPSEDSSSAEMGAGEDDGEDEMDDIFSEGKDFDDEVSKRLSEEAEREIRSSDYQVFSADWDRVVIGEQARDPESGKRMIESVSHMVGSIQKSLERSIAAKARKTWNPGQRRGRIAPGSLFRSAVGDDRVFRTRYETQAKNTAVSLLVDCSGSMGYGDKVGTAARAAYALSATLERLKLKNEVIGFTTYASRDMKSAIRNEGMGLSYARTEALYMPVLKSFSERLSTDAISRIAHLTERPSWLRENVDGESLQVAAHRLKSQKAERHVLIVLSDGSPACSGDYGQLCWHLKHTATALEKDGVEVIGIGIQDKSVRSYYSKCVVLQDLSELPTVVVGQLAKVLLAH